MNLDDLDEALIGDEITSTETVAALILVLIGFGMYLLIGRTLRKSAVRWSPAVVPKAAADALIRFAQILVFGVFIFWALSALGASMGWLTFVVVALLAIGALLAKPFVDGLVSTAVILSRSAIAVGDEIEVDDTVGEVKGMTNRSTVIETSDGRRVHIPNSELIDKTVTIYTAHDQRTTSIRFTVAADTDITSAENVIREAIAHNQDIVRVGSVRAVGFSEGIDLSVGIEHGSHLSAGNEAVDVAVRLIKTAFEEHGIQFAPSTSVRIEGPAAEPYDDQRGV
jgi:small-conductance mechanosensitive channel